ncbi:MAG TPA: hypothetical protein PKC18_08190 [Lacipirellulaceae bacterium]|nr:hypothetical protein [Lacipirellulaceae bacterium]
MSNANSTMRKQRLARRGSLRAASDPVTKKQPRLDLRQAMSVTSDVVQGNSRRQVADVEQPV